MGLRLTRPQTSETQARRQESRGQGATRELGPVEASWNAGTTMGMSVFYETNPIGSNPPATLHFSGLPLPHPRGVIAHVRASGKVDAGFPSEARRTSRCAITSLGARGLAVVIEEALPRLPGIRRLQMPSVRPQEWERKDCAITPVGVR